MDNMGWDVSPAVITNAPSLWSHQQHDIEEDIFASINHDLQKTDPSSHGNSNPEGANFVPNLDLYSPQYQEAAMKLAFDTMLANSQRGTSWGKGVAAELGSSSSPPPPPTINRPQIMSSLGSFMADFGVSSNAKGVSTTGSIDSLDCLLSATNSSTDNRSVEDDGISMILSECKNLWNFGEYSDTNLRNKDNYNKYHSNLQVHELDETVSQSSSTTKRSNDQSGTQLKVGENCSLNIHLFQSNSLTLEEGFRLIQENQQKPKKPRSERCPSSSNISFQQPSSSVSSSVEEPDSEAIAQMKEMIYRAAAFRPVNLGVEVVEKPKRKNVRISNDPQTVAARQRRERISDRIRVLQRLVPGGTKMDTATMLDEAANYLKFLRSQVKALETLGRNKEEVDLVNCPTPKAFLSPSVPFNHPFPMQIHFPLQTSPSPIHQPKNCEGCRQV